MANIQILSALYVNSGVYATPTWDEADLVADANLDAAWDKGTSDSRRSRVHTFEPTQLALALTGKILKEFDDPVYIILREAFLNNAMLDVLVLDGKVTKEGSEGYRYFCKVFGWGEDQAMGNVVYKDFDISPVIGPEEPMAALVNASGVVEFSAIGETEGS